MSTVDELGWFNYVQLHGTSGFVQLQTNSPRIFWLWCVMGFDSWFYGFETKAFLDSGLQQSSGEHMWEIPTNITTRIKNIS